MRGKVVEQDLVLNGYKILEEIHNTTSEIEEVVADGVTSGALKKLGKVDFLVDLMYNFFDIPLTDMSRIQIKCEDPVQVTCYGETKTWERKDALDFYLEAMHGCEGAERDRYVNIYYQLARGAKEAHDY